MPKTPPCVPVLPDDVYVCICKIGGPFLLANCAELSKRFHRLMQPVIDETLQDFIPGCIRFCFPRLDLTDVDDIRDRCWWGIHIKTYSQDLMYVSTRNLRGRYVLTQYICENRLEPLIDKQGFALTDGRPDEYWYEAYPYSDQVLDLEMQETIVRRAKPTMTGIFLHFVTAPTPCLLFILHIHNSQVRPDN